jgi:hypothetical protein
MLKKKIISSITVLTFPFVSLAEPMLHLLDKGEVNRFDEQVFCYNNEANDLILQSDALSLINCKAEYQKLKIDKEFEVNACLVDTSKQLEQQKTSFETIIQSKELQHEGIVEQMLSEKEEMKQRFEQIRERDKDEISDLKGDKLLYQVGSGVLSVVLVGTVALFIVKEI